MSLAEFGEPLSLRRSGGWILTRPIPGFQDRDAMGCYPVFACRDWEMLADDLKDLKEEIVCLSLVTDPFGALDANRLQQLFPDVCFLFKLQYVADLSLRRESFVQPRHRRKAMKALETISVECSDDPAKLIDEWIRLYANLTRRHTIRGIAAFSNKSFALQLQVPGIVVFRAAQAGVTIGMNLWYVHGQTAYYHLGAYDEQGYALQASFALFWQAIDYFTGRGLRYLSLGAGAGLADSSENGLNRFKRGWATETRPVYFCGRIFNRSTYDAIIKASNVGPTSYFPAYRRGEFGGSA